jgi:hypothetical protein
MRLFHYSLKTNETCILEIPVEASKYHLSGGWFKPIFANYKQDIRKQGKAFYGC